MITLTPRGPERRSSAERRIMPRFLGKRDRRSGRERRSGTDRRGANDRQVDVEGAGGGSWPIIA